MNTTTQPTKIDLCGLIFIQDEQYPEIYRCEVLMSKNEIELKYSEFRSLEGIRVLNFQGDPFEKNSYIEFDDLIINPPNHQNGDSSWYEYTKIPNEKIPLVIELTDKTKSQTITYNN